MLDVNAYDAGTEMNTEDFADMVPPCQGLIGVSLTMTEPVRATPISPKTE